MLLWLTKRLLARHDFVIESGEYYAKCDCGLLIPVARLDLIPTSALGDWPEDLDAAGRIKPE